MENKWVSKKSFFKKIWLFLLIFFLIGASLVTFSIFYIKSTFAAPGTDSSETLFIIKPGETTAEIAKRLESSGFIKDARAFRLYVKFACEGVDLSQPISFLKSYEQKDCLAGNIQAGSFKLPKNLELPLLAEKLTKGRLDSWVKLLEGWRNEEMAAELSKNYPISEEDFLKIAEIGYMYPDTYLFKVNSNASEIVERLRSTFDEKFGPELHQKVKANGLTIEEAVTLASLVERETRNDGDERATVAGILLKRLREGWRLEVDASVQYALGYSQEEKTWWRKSLTVEDLQIDSPYNTRKISGLPPGPICNPSITSLQAVASPLATDYYFYLHDKDGKIHYAKTLEEHNANKSKYL